MKRLGWLMMAAALAFAQGTQDVRLKAAMHKEEVEGDLKGAIEAYRKIVAGAGANRALAATALYRLGECYRKQGDVEARKTFERIVREYGDQMVAADARARLAAMGAGTAGEVRARLLWDHAADMGGKVSADGRWLSYTDWETGDLAVRDLVAAVNRRVTNKGGYDKATGEVENSAISPDGKRIAFTWYRWNKDNPADFAYELRSIDTDGKNEKVLLTAKDVRYIQTGSWSPDRRWFAVEVSYAGGEMKIMLASPDGAAVKTVHAQANRSARGVLFSPDGKWLAFDSVAPFGSLGADSGKSGVWVVAAVESGAAPVQVASNATVMGWTPGGEQLLFARELNGVYSLYRLPVADGEPGGDAQLIRSASDVGPLFLGMTTAGTLIHGSAKRTTEAVTFALDAASGTVGSAKVTIPVAAFGLAGQSGGIRYSPDGKRVLLTISEKAILIRSLADGTEHTIMPQLARIGRVEWSRDSQSLLISGAPSGGQAGVYRVNLETGAATLVCSGESIWLMAEASDGSALYYWRPRGPIVARDLKTGSERTLTDAAVATFDMKLSRDRKLLAVVGFRNIRIVDLVSGEVRTLYEPAVRSSANPAFHGGDWSADGRKFFVMATVDSHHHTELWSLPVDGGEPARQRLDGPYRGVWVSPDGVQLASVKWEQVGQVWSLENFLAEK